MNCVSKTFQVFDNVLIIFVFLGATTGFSLLTGVLLAIACFSSPYYSVLVIPTALYLSHRNANVRPSKSRPFRFVLLKFRFLAAQFYFNYRRVLRCVRINANWTDLPILSIVWVVGVCGEVLRLLGPCRGRHTEHWIVLVLLY